MGGSVGLGRGSLLLGLGTTGSVGWRMSLWSFPGSLEGQNLKQGQAWRQKGREGRQNSPLWDSFNLRSLAFIFLLYILISPKPFHTFSAASGDRHYLKNQYFKLVFFCMFHTYTFFVVFPPACVHFLVFLGHGVRNAVWAIPIPLPKLPVTAVNSAGALPDLGAFPCFNEQEITERSLQWVEGLMLN